MVVNIELWVTKKRLWNIHTSNDMTKFLSKTSLGVYTTVSSSLHLFIVPLNAFVGLRFIFQPWINNKKINFTKITKFNKSEQVFGQVWCFHRATLISNLSHCYQTVFNLVNHAEIFFNIELTPKWHCCQVGEMHNP